MNEQEVAAMVVRLTGDGASYQKMLTQAQTSTVQTAQQVETSAKRIEAFSASLKTFAQSAVGALASFGVATSLRSAFEAYSQLEQGQIRLNAAITAGGREAGPLIARYTQVAESIAAVTLNTKGSTLALFRQAETMGLSGDAAETAVRQAVALAGATGQEASSMLFAAAQMQRGNFSMVQRALRIRDVKDETELLRQINARMASGMAQEQAIFNSAGGRLERLGRSLKSITVDMGKMVADAIMPVVKWMQRQVDLFKSLDPEIKKTTALVVGLTLAWLGMGPVLATLSMVAGIVFTPMTVAIGAVAAAIGIVISQMGGFAQAWETVQGVISDVISTVRQFVAENSRAAVGMGLVAAAIAATVASVKVAAVAWSMVGAVLATLRIQQIASVAAWLAVKAALAVVAVATWVLISQFVLWTAVVRGVTAAVYFMGAVLASARLATVAYQVAVMAFAGAMVIAQGAVYALTLVVLAGNVAWSAWRAGTLGATIATIAISAATSAWTAIMGTATAAIAIMRFAVVSAATAMGAWRIVTIATVVATNIARGATIAWAATLGAFRLAALAWSAVMGVATGVTATWTLGTLAAKAMTILWGAALAVANLAMGTWSVVMGAATVATGIWTGVTLVAKAAVWLLNAALTATMAIVAPAIILAIVATVGLLGAAFVVVASAAYGVYTAVGAVLGAMASIPTSSGPLAAIGAMFGEWFDILKHVVSVAQTDIPSAFRILSSGFNLAVSQVRDLFPPLWEFIKEGFSALWELSSTQFTTSFLKSLNTIGDRILSFGSGFAGFLGINVPGLRAAMAENLKDLEGANLDSLREAERRLAAAVAEFGVKDSPATRAARWAVEVERWMADELAAALEPTTDVIDSATASGAAVGSAMTQGMAKELGKFDATLAGSAEAITRLESYRDMLDNRSPSRPLAGIQNAGAAAADDMLASGGPNGGGGASRVEGLLSAMVAHLATIADKDPLEIETAQLGVA